MDKVKKVKIDKLQRQVKALKFHHPGDDDPTGEFYTVREKRRSLREKIRFLKG